MAKLMHRKEFWISAFIARYPDVTLEPTESGSVKPKKLLEAAFPAPDLKNT